MGWNGDVFGTYENHLREFARFKSGAVLIVVMRAIVTSIVNNLGEKIPAW